MNERHMERKGDVDSTNLTRCPGWVTFLFYMLLIHWNFFIYVTYDDKKIESGIIVCLLRETNQSIPQSTSLVNLRLMSKSLLKLTQGCGNLETPLQGEEPTFNSSYTPARGTSWKSAGGRREPPSNRGGSSTLAE